MKNQIDLDRATVIQGLVKDLTTARKNLLSKEQENVSDAFVTAWRMVYQPQIDTLQRLLVGLEA